MRKITSKIWIIRHWLPKTCCRLGKIWKSLPNIRNRMQNSWHIWHWLPNTVDIRHWWQNSWLTGPWLPHTGHIGNRLQNIGYSLRTISIIIWPINPINNMPISGCHASITNLRLPLNSSRSFRLHGYWLPCSRLRRNSPATGRTWTVTEATWPKESVKSPRETIGAGAGVCNDGKNFLPGSVTIVDCITSKGKNGRGKVPAEERSESETLPVGADSLEVTWPPSVADTEVMPNATSASPPDTASLLKGICVPSLTSSPCDWILAWNKSDNFETFDTN